MRAFRATCISARASRYGNTMVSSCGGRSGVPNPCHVRRRHHHPVHIHSIPSGRSVPSNSAVALGYVGYAGTPPYVDNPSTMLSTICSVRVDGCGSGWVWSLGLLVYEVSVTCVCVSVCRIYQGLFCLAVVLRLNVGVALSSC